MRQFRLMHKNPVVRGGGGHGGRRLIVTVGSAIVCSLVAIVIVGIIDQQPANQYAGQPTGQATRQATVVSNAATSASPSPTAQPLLSEILPPLVGAAPTAEASATATATRYYTETGHNVSGDFLAFYDSVPESASLFGLPLTEEFSQQMPDGTSLKVQYFERARLEYHPDANPHVQPGILASEILRGRSFPPVPKPAALESGLYFTDTEHTLSVGFLEFWQSHGGLPIFGYPLSEELGEDGLTVQYFERARMEYHQDLVGTPYGVQLSPVGYLALQAQLPNVPAGTLVSFNPPAVPEGHTAEIDVNAAPGVTVTGTYEGRPLFFTYDPSRGVAWSLIGAVPFQDIGTHQVLLKVADGSTEGHTIVRNMNVLSYPFPSDNLQLDNSSVNLLASAVVTDEEASLATIFAGRTPQQNWRGRFSMPLDGLNNITSYFAARRCYNCPVGAPPTTYHTGYDIAANTGTPVHASADGVVVFVGTLAVRGNTIIIDHGLGVYTLYGHNSALIARRGSFVHQRDTIALSGNSGLSTGPHLSWEMHVSGPAVDAQEWVTRAFP